MANNKAAAQAAKKAKTRKTLIAIAIILVAALIITPLAMFANGSFYRLATAVTVGNDKYSVTEYNYYFSTFLNNTYSNLQTQYGEMASYILDTSKPLDEQTYNGEMTWADYFRSSALNRMQNVSMLGDEAKKAGFTLSEEQQSELDQLLEVLPQTASLYGYSTNGYLNAAYGTGMNLKVYEKCVRESYYAECYAESVADAMTYTQDELNARYAENPQNYDTVDYHAFLIAAADSDDTEAAMAAAKTSADEMAANVSDTASFAEYVRNLSDADAAEAYADDTATLNRYTKYSALSSTSYADWLFDAARQTGDTMVAEESNGYTVVMFVGRADTHYNLINIRHILFAPEADEETGEITEEAIAAAKAEAEEAYNTWKSGEATEESFAAMATEKSDDTGSTANGGLYEGVYKGQMIPAFNDWCFDDARQPGDTGIVETSAGYHVMYFVGEGEEYWTATLTNELQTEEYAAWQAEIIQNYPIVPNEKMLRYGRHS